VATDGFAVTAPARLRQMAAFYGVGLLNTAVDVALFWLLSTALGVPYLLAQALAYAAGATQSYLLNRTFTFHRQGRPHGPAPLRFAVVNLASLVAAAAVLYDLHGLAAAPLLAAKAAATLVGAAVNYAGSAGWAFRDDPAAI
jgi:putative flippase GtrA